MRVIFTLVSVLAPNTPIGAAAAAFTGAAAALGGACAGGAALACVGAWTGAGADACTTAAFTGTVVAAAVAVAAGVAATGATIATSSSPIGMMTNKGSPTLISSPSAAKVSTTRPAKGLRTSTVT